MAKHDSPRPLDIAPLVNRFFPGYSLRSLAADSAQRKGAYYLLVPNVGSPVDIGNTWGTVQGLPEEEMRNSQLDDFVRGREIPIADAAAACAFAQLVRGLSLGPYAVGSHDVPTVESEEAGWVITFNYVGPERDIEPAAYFVGTTNGMLRFLSRLRR